MTDNPVSVESPGPIEVRIFRDGELAHRRLCESTDEAVALVEQWADRGATQIDVDDLSGRHRGGQILEPDLELDEPDADDSFERR
jgi:hypothetical protein